jgi:hypothetical protein
VRRGETEGLAWREWISRYGFAEICGTIGSYIGFYGAYLSLGSLVAASFGAAIGENVGFYGCIAVREIAQLRRSGRPMSTMAIMRIGRALVYEFGAAELIDFAIVRPGATLMAVSLLGGTVGVLVGKVAADIVFYSMAIFFFERRRVREVHE